LMLWRLTKLASVVTSVKRTEWRSPKELPVLYKIKALFTHSSLILLLVFSTDVKILEPRACHNWDQWCTVGNWNLKEDPHQHKWKAAYMVFSVMKSHTRCKDMKLMELRMSIDWRYFDMTQNFSWMIENTRLVELPCCYFPTKNTFATGVRKVLQPFPSMKHNLIYLPMWWNWILHFLFLLIGYFTNEKFQWFYLNFGVGASGALKDNVLSRQIMFCVWDNYVYCLHFLSILFVCILCSFTAFSDLVALRNLAPQNFVCSVIDQAKELTPKSLEILAVSKYTKISSSNSYPWAMGWVCRQFMSSYIIPSWSTQYLHSTFSSICVCKFFNHTMMSYH